MVRGTAGPALFAKTSRSIGGRPRLAHGSSGHRSLSEVLTVFAPRDTRTAASERHRTPVTESEVKRSYHPLCRSGQRSISSRNRSRRVRAPTGKRVLVRSPSVRPSGTMTDSTPRCAAGDRTISHPAFAALYDRFMPDRFLIGPHREYLAADLSGRVLDIGAGNGVMIPYVAAAGDDLEYHAIEPDPHMRRRAAREARGTSLQRFTSAETTPSHYRTPTTASTSSSRVWSSVPSPTPRRRSRRSRASCDRAANCASSSTSVTTAGGLERRTPSRRCGNALRAAVS